MWQVEVPRIISSRPGSTTPAGGSETCASMFATATGVPTGSPVSFAPNASSPPARVPAGYSARDSFSSTTRANRGSSPPKNSSDG